MGLTGLIAFLAMAALVAPQGEGRVMDALVVCGVALIALTALATSREHRTYRAAVTRHWAAAALLWGGFIACCAGLGVVGWLIAKLAFGDGAPILPLIQTLAMTALLFPLVRPLYMLSPGASRLGGLGRGG